jgi:hypothetical protein
VLKSEGACRDASPFFWGGVSNVTLATKTEAVSAFWQILTHLSLQRSEETGRKFGAKGKIVVSLHQKISSYEYHRLELVIFHLKVFLVIGY